MTPLGVHFPFGTRLPDSLHAVSVSMPTLQDIIAYEEGDQAVLKKLKSGYPRFVRHELILQIERHWQRIFDKPQHTMWLASSEAMARRLESWLNLPDSKLLGHRGVFGIRIPKDPDANRQAKLFLQHVGGKLSTRQAEDYLIAESQLESPFGETPFQGDAKAEVIEAMQPMLGAPKESILLANSGMNAFFATFEAVNALQKENGRHSWIKLGWLYADTMHILDKMSAEESDNAEFIDVHDLDSVERLLEENGDRFAGLITEAPTNPLVHTMDLQRIRDLATRHGVYLVIDPTLNSPANVDVSPFADVSVTSLTKYAGNEGDVIMGIVAVSPDCPQAETLLSKIGNLLEPVFPRDLARLAAQINGMAPLVRRSNANTARMAAYLDNHPKVDSVHWAKASDSAPHYERIARSGDAVGSMISFTVKGNVAAFYDNLLMPKGPSFGLNFSIICPFIYLAHYDLITSSEGQRRLAQAGVDKDLLRLSIGKEDPEQLIEVFEAAFAHL